MALVFLCSIGDNASLSRRGGLLGQCWNEQAVKRKGMEIEEKKMKLFYSYSHKDEEFRNKLEKHLSVLKQRGHIEDWHDRKILPGQDFQKEIDQHLKDADVIALLISSDFLSSDACQEEMQASLNARKHRGAAVVPIIVRPCDWQSSDIGQLQALPKDGKAVSEWLDRDAAFLSVVEGISVMTKEGAKLEVRSDFRMRISEMEFVSENKEDIQLQDIFVFPHVVKRENDSDIPILDFPGIWDSGKRCLLRGDDRSGKTVICRKMFLERIASNEPTVLLSGNEIRKYKHQDIIRKKFGEEFDGSYDVWEKKNGKMLIVDDFQIESESKFIDFAKDFFDYIFVTVSDDQYAAYYRSQSFLSDFRILNLRPLKHSQQEELIRKWKVLGCGGDSQVAITDGAVDHLENTINAIVFRNRVVPRFPFYVLSILQTYEAFMPRDLQLTAYGHCYHVLIVAQLMRSGIARDDLDSAINCLSSLAFDLYKNRRDFYGLQEFSYFLDNYRKDFVIKESTIDRLTSAHKPIIRLDDGAYSFRYPFAYYYLLGYYLAKNIGECKSHIQSLTEKSYVHDNTFILIFTIHHSHDDDLIDDILLYTMEALDKSEIAKLDREETRLLEVVLREIPEEILTKKSVREARTEERDRRDRLEEYNNEREDDRAAENELGINDIYRALKNMEILGQILTNKYGSLSKERIREIIITVNDAGLRLVRSLTSEGSLLEFEDFIVKKIEDIGADRDNVDNRKLETLRKALRALILILVYVLIRKTSASIGRSELSGVVREVTNQRGTTAYKLVDLFFSLNTAQEIKQELADRIVKFLQDCSRDRNEVVRRIISLEVQNYCNTHNVNYKIRQRLFGELKLPYRPNIIESE